MNLAPAARRHIAALLHFLTPEAGRLERQEREWLRRRDFGAAQAEALLGIGPAAAARLGSLARFLKQVDTQGRRLAKLNVPPEQVSEVQKAFDTLLDPLLAGRFGPAREQLQLAATLVLHEAYYQVREGETQALFGLYRAEIEAKDYDALLRRFAAILARALQARTVRVATIASAAALGLGRARYITRGTAEEALILDVKMRGRSTSYWSFPLTDATVVQFGLRRDRRWLPREAALVEAAAQRCREASERLRLAHEVRRLESEARRAEEEERRRIGRELHDEAGQSLLLLRLQLEVMEREAPPALKARLSEAREAAARTVSELRRIVAALSPAVLERMGLEAALRHLAGRFRKTCPAALRTRIALPAEPIPPELQQVIYRIAQESLHNIARHSQANHVNLSLQAVDKGIRFQISDNGTGFRSEAAGFKPASFGLAGMQDRAVLLGGSLLVHSAPGKGTRIRLFLPCSPEAEFNGKDSRTHH